MMTAQLPPVEPQVALPVDTDMAGLPRLFDSQWVWDKYCANFGVSTSPPQYLRAQSLTYRPGRRAMVSYVAVWPEEFWRPDDRFAIDLRKDLPDRLFHFPDDPFLPGLLRACNPAEAPALVTQYANLHPRRVLVDVTDTGPATMPCCATP